MAAKVVHPMMSFSPAEWMDGWMMMSGSAPTPTRCFFLKTSGSGYQQEPAWFLWLNCHLLENLTAGYQIFEIP
jgi:hypothetical protein